MSGGASLKNWTAPTSKTSEPPASPYAISPRFAPTPAKPPLVAVESGDPRTVTHGGPGDNLQAAAT